MWKKLVLLVAFVGLAAVVAKKIKSV